MVPPPGTLSMFYLYLGQLGHSQRQWTLRPGDSKHQDACRGGFVSWFDV